MNKRYKNYLFSLLLIVLALLYSRYFVKDDNINNQKITEIVGLDIKNLPKYNGKPYITINGNKSVFLDSELTNKSFEKYSDLDFLGRCSVADTIIGIDLMPKEKRESIGKVKPTGWKSIKDTKIDGGSLYNRCHLIGFQLAGENANEKNLITGTRYLNVKGMLPFENMINDYVKETKNHVRYRVTPIFVEDELVARGVLMEAKSVEDNGKAIDFNVYCFNVQPGYEIDYKTGNAKKIK